MYPSGPAVFYLTKESIEKGYIVSLGLSVCVRVVGSGRHKFGTQARADFIEIFSDNLVCQ